MVRPPECLLTVTAVLLAVVHSLVRLALALRLGNATAPIAMMRMVASILAVAFRNSFVTSVGHVSLLLLAAVVVVSSSHGSPICSMLCQRACQLGRAMGPRVGPILEASFRTLALFLLLALLGAVAFLALGLLGSTGI